MKVLKPGKAALLRTLAVALCAAALAAMRLIDPAFRAHSGGEGMLDMRFGYGAGQAYQLLRTLGAEGRGVYVWNLCVDFVFIASFAWIQDWVLTWAMGGALMRTAWHRAWLITWLRALLDVMENLIILALIAVYPAELPGLAGAAGVVTACKFVALGLWAVAVPAFWIARNLGKRRGMGRADV